MDFLKVWAVVLKVCAGVAGVTSNPTGSRLQGGVRGGSVQIVDTEAPHAPARAHAAQSEPLRPDGRPDLRWRGDGTQDASLYAKLPGRSEPTIGAWPMIGRHPQAWGNPGGKKHGASARAAADRALAANPDADGLGAHATTIGEGLVIAATQLSKLATSGAIDANAIKAVSGAVQAMCELLNTIEPNVKRSERVETSQRVVLRMDAPRAEPGGRVVEQASASGAGPIHDAPLPSLGAKHEDPTPPASPSTPASGPPCTEPAPTPPGPIPH